MNKINNSNRLLVVQDLHKSYHLEKSEIRVLKGVTMEVLEGEIVAIVGPSGVGKSTLLHIVGALDRPTSGQVFINDVNIFTYNDVDLARFRNQSIGFVFQFHHLLPEFSALENVMMPALISGNEDGNIRQHAMHLLNEVGLAHRARHRPGELSGGEQQRLAVARSLINSPMLILADEPSGNLDKASSQSLHRLFWDLNNRINQTIIIVTHNIDLAQRADRIVELSDGRIKPEH
ncbi:ATP-binding cassette domain-containing protein [candidate division KSB1 bacterium]|nr:ATP-binding cassette domain-containing protein [candidate division KSB1 bacterium]